MASEFTVKWIDRHREPQCPPNPDYPVGVDLDTSLGLPSCKMALATRALFAVQF